VWREERILARLVESKVFAELLAAMLFALECLAECLTEECFAVDFFAEDVFAGTLTIASADSLLEALLATAAEFALNSGAAKAAASDVITRIFSKQVIIRFLTPDKLPLLRRAKNFLA
jgi:hypothetical protein